MINNHSGGQRLSYGWPLWFILYVFRSGDSSYTSLDETCGFGHVPLAFGYFSILSSRGGMSKQSLDDELFIVDCSIVALDQKGGVETTLGDF